MSAAVAHAAPEPLRLHIGGRIARHGWKILNIQPGPEVDLLGSCTDLGAIGDGAAEQVYASHVLEHLGYQDELPRALAEIHRVLRPGGRLLVSVPDLDILCRMVVHPELRPEHRFHLMRILYGGQIDPFDFHKVGFTFEILCHFLGRAGFGSATRVADHGLFEDTSRLRVFGQAISLNVVATR
jgi:predicted SAM-dependent methyltransferase